MRQIIILQGYSRGTILSQAFSRNRICLALFFVHGACKRFPELTFAVPYSRSSSPGSIFFKINRLMTQGLLYTIGQAFVSSIQDFRKQISQQFDIVAGYLGIYSNSFFSSNKFIFSPHLHLKEALKILEYVKV
jgi:hypothetical protein